MSKSVCALGCSPTKNLFIFPSRKHDIKRRRLWLDFFDLEEPNIASVFAFEKHFSSWQTTSKGIRSNAVPDIPAICDVTVHPFRRKPKNWRKNVIVVTPRDPEFNIYRHETGVFPQNLFSSENTQPVIQMPIIKSVSCSMSTQTNTHLCGLVQISDVKEEFRLNCFYCSEMFPLEKWSMFVNHLRITHFRKKEAFKMSKYFLQDHDYTSFSSPKAESVVASPTKFNGSFENLPPQTVLQQQNFLSSVLTKPFKHIEIPINKCEHKTSEIMASPLPPKPQQSNNTTFNISMADQVIKLLNETLLSPQFVQTEDDNILIIKNTGSDNIEASTFLKSLMNSEGEFSPLSQAAVANIRLKKPNSSTSTKKNTRPVYTISKGLQAIPSRRNSLSHLLFPPLPKNKKVKLVQKRIAQQTLKNINIFENIYKMVKKRPPKVVDIADLHDSDVNSKITDQQTLKLTPLNRCLKRTITETSEIRKVVEIADLHDSDVNNKVTDQQTLKLTPLNRCLKRTITETSETMKAVPKKSTEIVFEYTPEDIVISLLENMKNYPVLWEFHYQPFNKDYNRAIEKLCRVINGKWSLNITTLEMKRSIIRILRFYRFKLPSESINEFENYFDKCALFLPSSPDEIPRARCAYCCICYNEEVDLRTHMVVQHKALKWPYKCQTCLERFRECDEYELHKRLPHYEEIFKCELCGKRFNHRYLYNKHVACHKKWKERRIKTVNPTAQQLNNFSCDICKRTFGTQYNLKRHLDASHKPVQTFKCHLCPKEFRLKAYLTLHLKTHNKTIDYICEVCGKGFVLKSILNEHMKKHTGEKITCNICNLKLRKCNLLRHLRLVHIAAEGTIESTFRARCYRYQKFLRPSKPYRRRRLVTPRRYNCKTCNIPFDCLKQLKDHNKQVHFDVKRITCQLCTVEFIYLNNLKRHYRDKHKLHIHQVFKLVDQKEDLNTVLAMKVEEMDGFIPFECTSNTQNVNQSDSYFEQERMLSDKIQDEIMKAVENLDKQEIRVDDDHSMNEFFIDLLN